VRATDEAVKGMVVVAVPPPTRGAVSDPDALALALHRCEGWVCHLRRRSRRARYADEALLARLRGQ
jgi:hypothetical protein